ncbi:hypothetical protein ACIRQY_18100 [Streptomyces sp. NPDC101490]|uniref:hypothetical protein n=1 Tax=Streptomyces sp. NPDC101490 TaxID=3366143 RepID=UPI003808F9B6
MSDSRRGRNGDQPGLAWLCIALCFGGPLALAVVFDDAFDGWAFGMFVVALFLGGALINHLVGVRLRSTAMTKASWGAGVVVVSLGMGNVVGHLGAPQWGRLTFGVTAVGLVAARNAWTRRHPSTRDSP